MKNGLKDGLTDYGKRVLELNRKSRVEIEEIFAKFFGESPSPSLPKYRLIEMITWREAIYDEDGNLKS